jgi:predicted nucleic acid-binding protein
MGADLGHSPECSFMNAELLVTVREQGRPRGARPEIAATARATDRTIVTADQEAFTDLPRVATINHR